MVQYSILRGWVTLDTRNQVDQQVVETYDGWRECDFNGNSLPRSVVTLNTLGSIEPIQTHKDVPMAELPTAMAYEYDDESEVTSVQSAEEYAQNVAIEAVLAYKELVEQKGKSSNQQGTTMNETTNTILAETKLSAQLVSGEILLDNIETIADKLVLSRLNWFQRMSISKQQKELAVTLATYAIVHALKTGGFGLTKYRLNHASLDYVTIAANQRMVKYLVGSLGIDTNVAAMFLKTPTVEVA